MSAGDTQPDHAALVHRFAALAEQTAALDGDWRWFTAAGVEGAIPFRSHFGVAIMPGEPLCAPSDLPRLLAAFLHACRRAHWYAFFAPASTRLAAVAPVAGCAAWKIGEEPIIDLARWTLAGRRSAALRAALNYARRVDVSAAEFAVAGERGALERVASAWRAQRRGPAIGFVLAGSPADPRPGRRRFVARHAGAIVAYATSAPLDGGNGVAIEHFVRLPTAPRGAIETAIVAALETHASEGVRWATLGAVPFRGSSDQLMPTWADPRRRLGAEAMLLVWRRAALIYRASALEQFKRKFPADRWEPLYAVNFPAAVRPRLGVGVMLELLPGRPGAWLSAAVDGGAALLRQRVEKR